jgi:hypothetical protein
VLTFVKSHHLKRKHIFSALIRSWYSLCKCIFFYCFFCEYQTYAYQCYDFINYHLLLVTCILDRGVPKGGAWGVTPPASENFVFFWSKSRKNEIFLLDLAKKGVVPPCLRDLGTPLILEVNIMISDKE